MASVVPGRLVASCDQLADMTWPAAAIPAIYIYDQFSFLSLDHELGHFLGLPHTFQNGCSYPGLFGDIPQHQEARPDSKGTKYTCTQIPFVSDYAMDYYVAHNSFSQDQIHYVRQVLSRLIYLPGSLKQGNARLRKASITNLEQGTTIACKSGASW